MNEVEPHLCTLRELVEQHDLGVELSFGVSLWEVPPVIHLDGRAVSILAELDGEVDIDIICFA